MAFITCHIFVLRYSYSIYQPALLMSRGRGSPSVMSGFRVSVQPAVPASPIRLFCEQ